MRGISCQLARSWICVACCVCNDNFTSNYSTKGRAREGEEGGKAKGENVTYNLAQNSSVKEQHSLIIIVAVEGILDLAGGHPGQALARGIATESLLFCQPIYVDCRFGEVCTLSCRDSLCSLVSCMLLRIVCRARLC